MRYETPSFERVAPVLGRLFGAPPCEAIARDEGGYSPAGRWTVRWPDGRTAFVKAEPAEVPYPDWGIVGEHRVYANVPSPIVPALLGFAEDDAGRVLAIEDLSDASWGVPLTERDAVMLSEAMDELASLSPPDGLPATRAASRWAALFADPRALVSTGLMDAAWIDANAAALQAAEATVDPAGDGLVHRDVWVQNWCRAARGAVLVDWAGAARGNPTYSRAFGEAGVRSAGGPAGLVMPHGNPGWAAFMAGHAAAELAEEGYERHPRLDETQRREAAATLAWACDELEIAMPSFAPGFLPAGPWRP